jgi:hypothetical protein
MRLQKQKLFTNTHKFHLIIMGWADGMGFKGIFAEKLKQKSSHKGKLLNPFSISG